MKKYSVITIVYNPNSTGNSRRKAADLERDLKKALPRVKIRLRATSHAGHAESIAYRTALLARHALVVSVSGDGGYNEVVNGALRAQKLGRTVTVGLIPAGNANDHYASRHRGNFIARVSAGDEDADDVIRVRARRLTRYGHSYAGLGLSPQAGEKLNETKINLWQEVTIVGRALLQLKSIKLLVDGDIRHYNSLVFSTAGRMSKVFRMPRYSPDDGLMEVSHIYHRNKFKLISDLMHAAVFGLPADEQVGRFGFETIRRTKLQIDGEILTLGPATQVTVDVMKRALHSIV